MANSSRRITCNALRNSGKMRSRRTEVECTIRLDERPALSETNSGVTFVLSRCASDKKGEGKNTDTAPEEHVERGLEL